MVLGQRRLVGRGVWGVGERETRCPGKAGQKGNRCGFAKVEKDWEPGQLLGQPPTWNIPARPLGLQAEPLLWGTDPLSPQTPSLA